MRSLRITAGLGIASSVLAVAAGPAFAKEKFVSGEFTANVPGQTIEAGKPVEAKGKGEVEALSIGPVKKIVCKGMSAKSVIESEKTPNMRMEIKFKGCTHPESSGSIKHNPHISFRKPLVLELHGNGATKVLTVEENETEVHAQGYTCKFKLPKQEIPVAAEKDPNREYEAIEYSPEQETVEGAKLKKFPAGFYEYLDIELFLKKILTTYKPSNVESEGVPPKELTQCEYKKGEEGAYNPTTGLVETTSIFEGEFEDYKIKNGSLGFIPSTTEPEV